MITLFNFEKDEERKKYIITIFGIKLKIDNNSNFTHLIIKLNKPLIKLLDKFMPKDKNKVVFTSYPDFSDSAYLFYEYLKTKKQDKFKKIIWLKDEKNSCHSKITDKIFWVFSFAGMWHLLTAKYIIHDHCNVFLDFLASDRHILFNLWHGQPIKTIGVIDDDILPSTKKRYDFMAKHSHWFVTSDIYKIIISSMFQINPKKVNISGIVRTDIIFKKGRESYIKDCFDLNGFNKIILYAPTYKIRAGNKVDVKTDAKNLFYLKEYDDKDFIKYLEDNNICLIIKPHPFEEIEFLKFLNNNSYNNKNNIKIITTNNLTSYALNLNELFSVTDLIISDFSSITIDYAISKKPILYLTNYLQNYNEGRGFILPDNLKILMPGETVNTYQELKNKITKCIKEAKANYTDEELKLIYKYQDGNSCERIFEIMKGI